MRRSDIPARWPVVIVLLHWTMTAALLAMILGGFAMSRVAEAAAEAGDFSLTVLGIPVFEAYQLHKSIGVLLFGLVLIRLLFRVALPEPDLPEHTKTPERFAARAAHVGLYMLMFGLPISGWLLAASSPLGIPMQVFGLFTFPHPIGPDAGRDALFHTAHWAGAWALCGLASVHTAAALKHHVINRDSVLEAMLPVRRSKDERSDIHAE